MRVLGATMLTAALLMLWTPVKAAVSTDRRSLPVLLLLGLPLGVLTGLVGVGGGFLIVPALVIVARLPMREATGASLVVMTMAAVAGLAGYIGRTPLSLPFIVPFALVAATGTIAGGVIAHRLPQRHLQRAFAVTLVLLASYVLIRS
jgi:uncharacterized membrane protein YfcA